MPNYVTNVLTVSGLDADERDLLVEAFASDHAFFDTLIRCPFLSDGSPQVTSLIVEWRMIHWGVKWDISSARMLNDDKDVEDKTSILKFAFHTAWDPPIQAFKTISTLFPHSIFELESLEEQCEFCSRYTFENGVVKGGQSASDAEIVLIFKATPSVFDLG